MTGDEAAVARVTAYIADWYAAWEQVRPMVTSMYDLGGLASAGRAITPLLNQVAQRHAAGRIAIGQGGFPLPHATHDPATEQVTGTAVTDERVRVVTTVSRERGSFHHVYSLDLVDGAWLISGIELTLEPPEATSPTPPVPPALRPPDPGLVLDVDGLFHAGREVAVGDLRSTIEVVAAPGWRTTGEVAVWDLAWGTSGITPLAPPPPAGTHPVEVAHASGRNVAVRVRFADTPVASWHPAGSVGVDSGTVALLDVAAVSASDDDQVEQTFTAAAARGDDPLVVPLSLGHDDAVDGVLVASGWGDGSYPVSWGADATGQLVALLVDFLVLAEPIEAEVRTPLAVGPVEDLTLAAAGMTYLVDHDGIAWHFVGTNTEPATMRILAPDGTELLDGDRLGILQQGDTWTQRWRPAAPVPDGSVLVLRVSTGYRHV